VSIKFIVLFSLALAETCARLQTLLDTMPHVVGLHMGIRHIPLASARTMGNEYFLGQTCVELMAAVPYINGCISCVAL
jgi:hypothetical protein